MLGALGRVCQMKETGKRMAWLVILDAATEAGPFISFRKQVY